MFYSQFILAKKGPLGTIWIAARLERKLRKNQVADTDIGVSVDSILSPDVPIALRLSSHLLLGVVRIYNKKVNYLFDDCSEALLKVKQAFRSTAVDLPPEESKAPYHSITLPEKFDLDDFELPDSDIFQGNYVDHHISSRDQITLQDTMEGVSYSTSKFGLDERFGDGDMSGLDLDEDLFLGKIGAEEHVNDERVDPSASFGPGLTLKQNQQPEDTAANSVAMGENVDELDDVMDYAHAPSTPGLVEEPNLSNVQDASACDDHLESEYHLVASTIRENVNKAPPDEQDADWCPQYDTISDAAAQGPSKENEYLSGGLEVNDSTPQGKNKSIRPATGFTNDIIKASDVSLLKDAQTEAVNEDERRFLPVNETCCNHQAPNDISLDKSASGVSSLANTDRQVIRDVSANDLAPLSDEDSKNVASNQQKSCRGGSELVSENQVSFVEISENQAFQGTTGFRAFNLDAHEREAQSETLVLRPCSSIQENTDATIPGVSRSTDVALISDINFIATDGREETANLGEVHINGDSEQNLRIKEVQEHASGEDIQLATSDADGLVHATNTRDRLVNLNNPSQSGMPVPEKLLSVPAGHMDLHTGMIMESSPVSVQGLDEGDAGSKTAAGRKRSFTESTLTEQSLNSVESSRHARVKQTIESVPNDDDLLSSILVGKRSSILKVRPTPPISEVTSMKRTRSAPRSSAPKRKVLMDDTMVLHGDTIRQQLNHTEDIRRVRKKAPCTLPEISMIQNQHMEDEIFLQPVLMGMSVDLASLHCRVYDLSQIRVSHDEVNDVSLQIMTEPRLPSQNDENGVPSETMINPDLATYYEKPGASVETVAELHLTSPKYSHNMEDDIGPDKTNTVEISGRGLNDEPFIVAHNERAEPGVNPLLSENKPEVDYASVASPPVLVVEPSDSTGRVMGDLDDDIDAMVRTASFEANAVTNTEAAIVSDQKKYLSVELDYTDLDNGEAIAINEVGEKDGYAMGESETKLEDGRHNGAAAELVFNANHEYHTEAETCGTMSKELQEVEFVCPGLEDTLHDGIMNDSGNPEHSEAYESNMRDAEFSGYDLYNRDELDYSATGNDTEFLNVDDDELAEMADDNIPDAEEAQYTENSGWSSRTRAVSKYLQLAFVKEAERGRMSLSLDNLLIGKTRKEASRMFFETLVLKTRDYIHVEQRNPFDDIAIKPRTRLMKSDF